LKLGQARGVVMLAPVLRKIGVAEYAPNVIKKTVVGNGHAEKEQVKHMVRILLPRAELKTADSVDALAIAICHAQHRGSRRLAEILDRS
jgi:crossover junction endodeoxyribonuclease RuvC